MSEKRVFFKYVIPAVLSFAFSGIYAIVDGYFVGNSIGDKGLSAINVAYPIVAVLQAAGTGIGMGGAVYDSISRAEKKEQQAKAYMAGALWLLLAASIILTAAVYFLHVPLLRLLGMEGELLVLGRDYIRVIALGAVLQILGTGLVPFIRNHGGPVYAMAAMISGFVVNIFLDFLMVWVLKMGMTGAALATIIGEGVTMLFALGFLAGHRLLTGQILKKPAEGIVRGIIRIGIAPFGLTMTPNLSLIMINRFSIYYGGEEAVAVYACIAYIICVVYLILQGVGDGCQPIISSYYGSRRFLQLRKIRKMAYGFGLVISFVSCLLMFAGRYSIGLLFGASPSVNIQTGNIIPIFLVSIPFVSICRVTTASFYATEESSLSYILTFAEPVLMLVCMAVLPCFGGGQLMIWWSSVIARVLSACMAIVMKRYVDRKKLTA